MSHGLSLFGSRRALGLPRTGDAPPESRMPSSSHPAVDGIAGGCEDAGVKRPAIAAGLVAVVAVTAFAVVWAAGGLGGDSAKAGSAFPEGVYRYRLTKDEVRKVAILPDKSLEDAVGTFTWTIRNGTISLVQTDCKCALPRVSSTYTAANHRLTVTWPKKVNGVLFCEIGCTDTVRWSFDGKMLRLAPLTKDVFDFVFWGAGKPWEKVE
jgi:hypothetical protein